MINIYLVESLAKDLSALDKPTHDKIRQMFHQIYDSVNQLHKEHDTRAPVHTRRQLAELAQEMEPLTFHGE